MNKLSSYVNYQSCNVKVEQSKYLDHLRNTHKYVDDRFLKVIVYPVFECKTKVSELCVHFKQFIKIKNKYPLWILFIILFLANCKPILTEEDKKNFEITKNITKCLSEIYSVIDTSDGEESINNTETVSNGDIMLTPKDGITLIVEATKVAEEKNINITNISKENNIESIIQNLKSKCSSDDNNEERE
uniref:DZF domain-containing protein n=1 Tax=Strongyloides venezuelensis TaxID=75913 RepID=A0A0K0F568_STRVS